MSANQTKQKASVWTIILPCFKQSKSYLRTILTYSMFKTWMHIMLLV